MWPRKLFAPQAKNFGPFHPHFARFWHLEHGNTPTHASSPVQRQRAARRARQSGAVCGGAQTGLAWRDWRATRRRRWRRWRGTWAAAVGGATAETPAVRSAVSAAAAWPGAVTWRRHGAGGAGPMASFLLVRTAHRAVSTCLAPCAAGSSQRAHLCSRRIDTHKQLSVGPLQHMGPAGSEDAALEAEARSKKNRRLRTRAEFRGTVTAARVGS